MTEDGHVVRTTPWPRPRRLGYAERDPTADVEGFDAAAKAAIIASIAFGAEVVAGDVYREGISGVTAADIAFAAPAGLRGQAARHRRGGSTATRSRCGCTRRWSPSTTRWPSVRESFNAVFVEGEAVGELMFYGRGAGGRPTASARARRPHRRRRATSRQGTRRRDGRELADGAGSGPIDELRVAVLPDPRRGRPARRAGRGGRRLRPTTTCRSVDASRRAWATRPG